MAHQQSGSSTRAVRARFAGDEAVFGRYGAWIVAVVALAASVAGLANDFTNDDIHLIANNARVQDLGNAAAWFSKPFWPPPFSPDLYRPLTSALLALEYIAGAGSPMVFRVVSYVLYAACAVGVFSLGRRMMPDAFAFGAALLFAAHPLHVEAVALGVGQAELVVALIAVAMCVLYVDRRRAGALRPRDVILLCGLYAVACLFKENALIIPALLAAAELLLIPERRVELGALLGMAAVAVGALAARRFVLGEFGGTFTAEALDGLSIGGRALTMLAVVPRWLHLLAWPNHLQADYSPQEIVASRGFGTWEALGLAIAIAGTAIIWLMRRRAPVVAFGLAWAVIALLPVSNVIVPTGVVLAERTLFLASVGFVIAAAGLAALAFEHSSRVELIGYACAALAAVGVGQSIQRQRVWRNEGYLVGRTVQDAPRSFRMQEAYADLLYGADQPALARDAYSRALELAPPGIAWRVHNDMARALARRGETTEQIAQLRASLAQRPDQEMTRAELVVAQLSLGEYASARAAADSAVARGQNRAVFEGLRAVADSAARVNARPGSVRITLQSGAVAASR